MRHRDLSRQWPAVFPNVSVDVLHEVLAVDSPILTIHSDINQSGLLKGGG